MKENKLKMKDIATIGIFSALLFVVTMLVGAISGISMTLYMFSTSIIALISAPLYMLIMARVHKKGAVLLTCAIVGILLAIFGGIFVLVWMLVLGLLGEVLATKTSYKNYVVLSVSFVCYMAAYYLGAIGPLYYYTDYCFTHGYTEEAANALISAAHSTAGYVAIPVMFAAAIIGALIAKKLLKKHFEKAGVL